MAPQMVPVDQPSDRMLAGRKGLGRAVASARPLFGPLLRVTLTIAFLLGMLEGCSHGHINPRAFAAGVHIKPVPLPIEELWKLTVHDDEALHVATQQLVEECVNAEGFEYPVPRFERPVQLNRRYGLIDGLEAASRAYALPHSNAESVDDVMMAYYYSLPAQQRGTYEDVFVRRWQRAPPGML